MPYRFILLVLTCSLSLALSAQPVDIPDARAGKCYAKCLVHDKFETVTEQVMVRPAASEAIVVPAELETVTGHYVAKESYRRLVVEPAVFETETERILVAPAGRRVKPDAYEAVEQQVLIRPATKTYEVTDAVFEQQQEDVETAPAYMTIEVLPQRFQPLIERIEVRPATTKWVRRKADRDCLSADPDDCFVWCMVEEPAEYQTLYKEIPVGCDGNGSMDCERYLPVAPVTRPMPVFKVVEQAQARELVEPAEYRTVTRWTLKSGATEPAASGEGEYLSVERKVLKRPARIREEIVPAEYKTIQRQRLKKEAYLVTESAPAGYVTITRRILVRKGGFSEWREIVCAERMTGYTVQQIQEVLRALGYFKGTVDGKMDTRTKKSLSEFQQERSLPADGNVDFETLKALGISL